MCSGSMLVKMLNQQSRCFLGNLVIALFIECIKHKDTHITKNKPGHMMVLRAFFNADKKNIIMFIMHRKVSAKKIHPF